MAGFFNLDNLTGSRFADWKPEGGMNAPVLKRLRAAPATPEPSTITHKELETMGTRSDIRAALSSGRVSFTRLKELLKGKNIATALSQMTGEGQLIKAIEGDETFYAIGREPGRTSGKRNKTGEKSRITKPGTKRAAKKPAKFKFQKSVRGSATAPDSSLQQVLTQLRLRRNLIDNAIAALEQLPS